MSSFSQGPQDGIRPEDGGPLLVLPSPPRRRTKWELWKRRITLIVFVLFCLEIGILLTVLPWTRVWTENPLLSAFSPIRDFLMMGFVRGVVSGLGLLDIWLAIAEAVRYRESMD